MILTDDKEQLLEDIINAHIDGETLHIPDAQQRILQRVDSTEVVLAYLKKTREITAQVEKPVFDLLQPQVQL